MRWLESITKPVDMNLRKLQEIVEDGKPSMLQSMGLDMTYQLNNNIKIPSGAAVEPMCIYRL